MNLDRTKPFAEVIGDPDVHYIQNGIKFDSVGRELVKKDDGSLKAQRPYKKRTIYEKMTNKRLSILMKRRGEFFTDRDQAIKFLNSQRASLPSGDA